MAPSASGASGPLSTSPPTPTKVPTAPLGRTGVEVSRLGIGCAWFQRKQVTPDDVAKTLHRALELGVTYLDTAPSYGTPEGGYAEEKMGHVLPEIRDRVFLVTKTDEPTYDGTMKKLDQSLKRMRVEKLDLVHLHNFGDEKMWGDVKAVFGPKGALGALRKAKEQGIVRFFGASGHVHPGQFHAALDTGEIDVLMNAANFVVQHTYDFEHRVWSRAARAGLGLVAMKVLGGAPGTEGGYSVPQEHYERAIRYVLSLPSLACAVIGLENIPELEKAAAVVARNAPLSPDESRETARLGLELAATEKWHAPYGEPLT
jgi:aryl-alcohol dehydrogenase-like predicted oxidoreductase